jgi:hypothetical protein
VSVSHLSQQPAGARAAQRTGIAMAVIMTGLLKAAVDTTSVINGVGAGALRRADRAPRAPVN